MCMCESKLASSLLEADLTRYSSKQIIPGLTDAWACVDRHQVEVRSLPLQLELCARFKGVSVGRSLVFQVEAKKGGKRKRVRELDRSQSNRETGDFQSERNRHDLNRIPSLLR